MAAAIALRENGRSYPCCQHGKVQQQTDKVYCDQVSNIFKIKDQLIEALAEKVDDEQVLLEAEDLICAEIPEDNYINTDAVSIKWSSI